MAVQISDCVHFILLSLPSISCSLHKVHSFSCQITGIESNRDVETENVIFFAWVSYLLGGYNKHSDWFTAVFIFHST